MPGFPSLVSPYRAKRGTGSPHVLFWLELPFMATTTPRIDVMLSTLNATDVGTLESIVDKLRQVKDELVAVGQEELAARAEEAIAALRGGDIAEFKRARAFLQSKIGHLRP